MGRCSLSSVIAIFIVFFISLATSAVLQPRDGNVTEGEFESGDSTFYDYPDPVPICGRGLLSQTCAQRGWWEDPDGTQVSWLSLKEADTTTLLQNAVTRGKLLKSSMDDAVQSTSSRINTPQGMRQDTNFRQNYKMIRGGVKSEALARHHIDINEPFTEAGITGADGQLVNGDKGFYSSSWASTTAAINEYNGSEESVLDISANGDTGILFSMWSYRKWDLNKDEDKAYSSTLTWNAWKDIAKDNSRKLIAQMRYNVINQHTRNIMDLLHKKYPQKLVMPPAGDEVQTVFHGRGVWKPGDEGYLALLSSPNVKTSVNMVIDRHLDMDNPYITEIHTFPENGSWGDGARQTCILIKYGPRPTGDASGTVESARI